jgi:beta-aspartyl-peptidase (threonine type)
VKLLIAAALALAACSHPAPPPAPHAFVDADKQAITDVVTKQAAAWNRGDLDGYMAGYAKIDTLVFTSGGKINRGWQTTYDRFKKRYGSDTTTMGQLSFTELEVTPVGSDGAVALGKWALETSGRSAGGVFTLVFAKRPEGWKIIHDHTSSTDKGAESTGIPECDDYIAAVEKLGRCDKLPQAARDAMQDGVDQQRESWKHLDSEGRRNSAQACRAGTDAIRQASSASGC